MPSDKDPKDNAHPDSSNMPKDRDSDDTESNPFVAFRRFADEQITSVLHSITGLPSAFSQPRSDKWTIFTDDQRYKDTTYRQQGGESQNHAGEPNNTSDSGAGDSSSGNKNSDETDSRSSANRQWEQDDRWRSNSRRNQHFGASSFFGPDSFFDRFEDLFMPFSFPYLHPRLHFSSDVFEDSGSPTWALPYILFSPYSPLHLEHRAYNRMHGKQGVFSSLLSSSRQDFDYDPNEPRWREAFEDLLRLENGKPMLDREALAASKAESGQDWIKGLVNRGSIGGRWITVSSNDKQPRSGIDFGVNGENNRLVPDNEPAQVHDDGDLEETESELDVYDRFLQDIEARERELFQHSFESPLLRQLLGEHRDHDDRYAPPRDMFQANDQQGNEDSESQLDLIPGSNQKSVSEMPNDPTTWRKHPPLDEDALRVVSEVNRTQRKRLADGSIQVKTVKVTHFADGGKETHESTEVYPPSSDDAAGASSDDKTSKHGWFWKD